MYPNNSELQNLQPLDRIMSGMSLGVSSRARSVFVSGDGVGCALCEVLGCFLWRVLGGFYLQNWECRVIDVDCLEFSHKVKQCLRCGRGMPLFDICQ